MQSLRRVISLGSIFSMIRASTSNDLSLTPNFVRRDLGSICSLTPILLAAGATALLFTAAPVLAGQHEVKSRYADSSDYAPNDLTVVQAAERPASRSIASRKERSATGGTDTTYPPYPDVWEVAVPLSKSIDAFPRIRSARLDNGDVLLGFFPINKPTERRSIAGIPSAELSWRTFFGRHTAIVDRDGTTIRLKDGSILRPAVPARSKNNYPGVAKLRDGTYVVSSQDASHDCYMGPAKSTLKHYQNKNADSPKPWGTLLANKVIFFVLDEPVSWSGADYRLCDEADKKLSSKVAALHGDIIPLDDGGFLLVDEHIGWVFRFTADLSTRTDLLGRRLFIFDLEPSMGHLFIDKFTGKSYVDERGRIQMQKALDDLYDFLTGLRKGEK